MGKKKEQKLNSFGDLKKFTKESNIFQDDNVYPSVIKPAVHTEPEVMVIKMTPEERKQEYIMVYALDQTDPDLAVKLFNEPELDVNIISRVIDSSLRKIYSIKGESLELSNKATMAGLRIMLLNADIFIQKQDKENQNEH